METLEVGKLPIVSLAYVGVALESTVPFSIRPMGMIRAIRLTYKGRKLDQIEEGGSYFFDIHSGEIVRVEL